MQQQMEMTRRMLEQMRQRIPNARRGLMPPMPFPNLLPAVPERGRPRNLDDRLGARVEPPSSALVDQLDLPKGQGMVLLDIKGDSAASKAGLKNNDILLELDGQPVPSDPVKYADFMAKVKADEAIDAVVLRKTRKETIKGVKLPRAVKREVEQPLLPHLKLLPLPPPPIAGGAGLSLRRVNDDFTATENDGSLILTVTGKVNNGKAELQKVVIKEDEKTTEYQKLEDIPAGQREKVEKLLRMAEGKPIQLNLGID
jgi:membrane-associated protease RseP (regulator of RpoE activity)